MNKFILGKKIGMSQLFDKNGKFTPVTLISGEPCVVLQEKTKEKDGYMALQIGFEKLEKKNKIKKTMKGKEYRHIAECRLKPARSATALQAGVAISTPRLLRRPSTSSGLLAMTDWLNPIIHNS